ncbi:MAG TPA: hypothetical protein VG873_16750 [Burkholderiales bacterium]|nr:hypothetical protein [Burkholderiales bacterium]
MRSKLLLLAAAALAGCASFQPLEPGKARLADVEARFGKPLERVALPDGGSRTFYSTLPEGRENFAVTAGADGVVREIRQQLTWDSIKRITPNATSAKDLRELLGPPFRVVRMERQQRDVWEYPWRLSEDRRILWVQVSYDGTVREVIEMHDYESDPPSGPKD